VTILCVKNEKFSHKVLKVDLKIHRFESKYWLMISLWYSIANQKRNPCLSILKIQGMFEGALLSP